MITTGLLSLSCISLALIYSTTYPNFLVLKKHLLRECLSWLAFMVSAQIPPRYYYRWAPWLYGLGMLLLIAVSLNGIITQGAQRWLNLGILHGQPSEFMKLAIPMLLARYMHQRPIPPNFTTVTLALTLIALPTLLIAQQPDLGTALLISASGGLVLVLAGLSRRFLYGAIIASLVSAPLLWQHLHSYQRQRILTFLHPERDPLSYSYHITQSKIAIGSGGTLGKGWLHGTQAHLHFIPERTTDFIYAVWGEEFGLIGGIILLTILLWLTLRGFLISLQAPDLFLKLLAASLSLNFFLAAWINISMVTGLLPVVGLPLPLISYGGTTSLTYMIGFGMLVSIHTHRPLSTQSDNIGISWRYFKLFK